MCVPVLSLDHLFKTWHNYICPCSVLIGSDMDPHCRIHNCFWSHVCQDLEGACHLQKCEDEEEGIEKCFIFYNEYIRIIKGLFCNIFLFLKIFTDTFDCSTYEISFKCALIFNLFEIFLFILFLTKWAVMFVNGHYSDIMMLTGWIWFWTFLFLITPCISVE